MSKYYVKINNEILAHNPELENERGYFWTTDTSEYHIIEYARKDVAQQMAKNYRDAKVATSL